ncbi:hypothetical protein Purlil1_13296 [Purpureocillium lilacinum]|uniref:Uncharacterized protein n=1 Tax=Purpureocillium lilacinum TaxID=33203 RepID=A0ABR0BET9_PURLI|nr:hypothetical protein Purlil1_13296 [Purpureocillium lilacinum]
MRLRAAAVGGYGANLASMAKSSSSTLGPFRRPTVIVSDDDTAVDICSRHRELDRGGRNKECVGITANFHFTMETRDPRFKEHRMMLRGLMSPQFRDERHFDMDEAKSSLSQEFISSTMSGIFQPGTKTAEFAAPPSGPEGLARYLRYDFGCRGQSFPFLAQMLALLLNPKHLRCFGRRRSLLVRQTDIRLARPENSPPQCALDKLLERKTPPTKRDAIRISTPLQFETRIFTGGSRYHCDGLGLVDEAHDPTPRRAGPAP